jgi:uncharacterized protein
VGLRVPHYAYVLESRPKISWFEVVSENFMGNSGGSGGKPLHILENIRKDYPIVLHGVSLSIGSADLLNLEYLKTLKSLITRFEPEMVSDHLCWTGVDGKNMHDLMPLPFTEEALKHVSEKVVKVQNYLGREILLENVSSYFTYTDSRMSEWEFLSEVTKRTGCGILLDINNIYVSSRNHGFDPITFLKGVPAERVKQFHLAGHSDNGNHLIDTHDHPVCDPVWDLYAHAVELFGRVPTLLERDDKIPPFEELVEELERAKEIEEKVCGKHFTGHPKSHSKNDFRGETLRL